MKNTKKAILAAAALVAAGLLITFGALAAMDFDLNRINSLNYVTNTYTVDETFTSISIESAECSLRLLPAEDDSCKVVCEESEEIFHSVTVENNTLTIDRTDARKWYEHIVGIYWGNMTITVYLPQTEYESLCALTVSGRITIPKDFSFNEAEIQSTSGNVDFLASVENDLSIKSVSGSLHTEDANPRELDIQSTSGKVNCSDITASGDMNIETVSGRVILSSVTAAKAMQIKTVSGNIELQSCDADSLRITSTSGKISGTLLTEKRFLTDTTSGHVDVPESSSGGKCEVKTTSGDIKFEIE